MQTVAGTGRVRALQTIYAPYLYHSFHLRRAIFAETPRSRFPLSVVFNLSSKFSALHKLSALAALSTYEQPQEAVKGAAAAKDAPVLRSGISSHFRPHPALLERPTKSQWDAFVMGELPCAFARLPEARVGKRQPILITITKGYTHY